MYVSYQRTVNYQALYSCIHLSDLMIMLMQNIFGESPLIGAAHYGQVATCKILIEHGATVDYQNNVSCTSCVCATLLWY